MKKKRIIIIIIVVIVLLALGITGYFLYLKPHNEAVKKYEATISVINEKNKELDGEISKLQNLVNSKDKPLDISLIESSKNIIKDAKSKKLIIPNRPSKTSEIIAQTEKYSDGVDYSEVITVLKNQQKTFETSQKQYKQFVKPTGDYVLQRVLSIDEISGAMPVTEDNDPNGNLNKPGGYTATIFFESKNINKEENFLTNDIIENGTDGGGAVEVYSSEEDAKKRNDYLSSFDGTVINSGSHKVVGTVVIRISNYFNITQQNELEQKVIDAIAKLD